MLFLVLSGVGVHRSNFLKLGVKIYSYNDHRSAPFFPSLLVGFSTTNSTRAWEPTLSWNQLRQKYVPIVAKVLDGRKTATFIQLDRRIAMMLELQVASQMPLVADQDR